MNTINQVSVTIDPRMELLSVVEYLSNYGENFNFNLVCRDDFYYTLRIKEYFDKHRNHPVIKLLEEMSSQDFRFEAPPTTMLYLSNPPELEIEKPLTDHLKTRAGGSDKLLEFVDQLRDFAVKSNFMNFYNMNLEFYNKMLSKFDLKELNYQVKVLENYYRMKQKDTFNIILAPLFHGNYGPRVSNNNAADNIYCIKGSSDIKNDIPEFNPENILMYIWHEFSHSYVNTLIDKNEDEIRKYSYLINPIKDKISKIGYRGWHTCIIEHLVRAVTLRLTFKELGREEGEKLLNKEKEDGFIYIESLCDKLKDFEKENIKYPTFNDFYPEIINVLENLLEK